MAQGLPTAFLQPGDVIGQRFRVERTVGQGAMGTVYEATDTSLRRRVAVKVMLSTGKAQRETIKTIAALASIGVEPHRIRVLFNMAEGSIAEDFGTILREADQAGGFIANPNAVLEKNEVFELLAKRRMSIKSVVDDPNDYRVLLRQSDPADEDRIEELGDKAALQALAKRVWRQMDVAFVEVFA